MYIGLQNLEGYSVQIQLIHTNFYFSLNIVKHRSILHVIKYAR